MSTGEQCVRISLRTEMLPWHAETWDSPPRVSNWQSLHMMCSAKTVFLKDKMFDQTVYIINNSLLILKRK